MINNEKIFLEGRNDARSNRIADGTQSDEYYVGWNREIDRLNLRKKVVKRSASSLKYNHEFNHPNSKFFTPGTMSLTGDYLSNFGVRLVKVRIADKTYKVYELYRRMANLKGLTSSVYFSTATYGLLDIDQSYEV